jgi:hypothetical protein
MSGTNGNEEGISLDDIIVVMCVLQEKVSLRDRLIDESEAGRCRALLLLNIKEGDKEILEKYGVD